MPRSVLELESWKADKILACFYSGKGRKIYMQIVLIQCGNWNYSLCTLTTRYEEYAEERFCGDQKKLPREMASEPSFGTAWNKPSKQNMLNHKSKIQNQEAVRCQCECGGPGWVSRTRTGRVEQGGWTGWCKPDAEWLPVTTPWMYRCFHWLCCSFIIDGQERGAWAMWFVEFKVWKHRHPPSQGRMQATGQPHTGFLAVLQNALTRAEGQKLDPGYYCHMWSAFAGNKPILSGTVGAQLIGLSVLLLHTHPLDLTDKPNKTNQHRKTHERPNSTLH